MSAGAAGGGPGLDPPELTPEEVEANRETQMDELGALEEIVESKRFAYSPANELRTDPAGVLLAEMKVDPPGKVRVIRSDLVHDEGFEVENLVPIELAFTFGQSYPSHGPPSFVLSCCWLGRVRREKLRARLLELALECEGDPILFSWYQFLQDEALEFLGVVKGEDGTPILTMGPEGGEARQHAASVPVPAAAAEVIEATHGDGGEAVGPAPEQELDVGLAGAPGSIEDEDDGDYEPRRTISGSYAVAAAVERVRAFDQKEKDERFKSAFHTCEICFQEGIVGTKCIKLHCSHVWCRSCIGGYFSAQIDSGEVKNMKCPAGGCSADALPTEVKEVVTPEDYEKYEARLLEVGLSEMADVIRCPRLDCQAPVILEKDTDMGECQTCYYVFCKHCKKIWHGIQPCEINDLRKVVEDYDNATGAEKARLEKMYGRKKLMQLVSDVKDMEYLRANSVPCPHCGAWISKIDGCNKMHCSRCQRSFCWLCGKLITDKNPYDHFNRPGGCDGKLFVGMMEAW